jgi:hypothetical protein
MAGDNEEFWTYDRAHVRIDAFRERAQYEFPSRPQDRAARRDDHHSHSAALLDQLAAALGELPAEGQDHRITIEGQKRGVLVELDTQPPKNERSGPSKTPALDYPPQGIEVLRSSRLADRTERALLFVPDEARGFLSDRITAYGQALGNKRRSAPPRAAAFSRGRSTSMTRSRGGGSFGFASRVISKLARMR